MELPIDLLKTFLAIIDTGGFTSASQVVHRTQSAISMQVRRLEDAVGQPLLERVGRSSKLTTEGERIFAAIAGPLPQHVVDGVNFVDR